MIRSFLGGRRVGRCGAGLVEAMEGRRYLSVSFGSEIGLGGFGGTHVAIADILMGIRSRMLWRRRATLGGVNRLKFL